MDIQIPNNARTFITGKTGSGKSYLAIEALKHVERLIVIDSKANLADDMQLEPMTKKAWRKFLTGKPVRMQIADPLPPHNYTLKDWDHYLKLAYYGANCTIYIDELMGITSGSQVYPSWLRALYTRGRQAIYKRGRLVGGNIGVVASTQRPANIPLFCVTESEYFFVFELNNYDDREKLAKNVAPELANPVQDEHGFYYYHIRDEQPSYAKSL